MLVVGEPILDLFADVGGDGAKRVLTAVARIDRGPLGVVAGAMAGALPATRMPVWMSQVGDARVTRAFSAYSPGDGEAIFLQVDDNRDEAHMVAAFISERRGGIAKQLGVIRVIDLLDPQTPGSDGADDGLRLQFREVDPILACRRVRIAVDRTDKHAHPPVGEEFSEHRALAIARVTPLSIVLRQPAAG